MNQAPTTTNPCAIYHTNATDPVGKIAVKLALSTLPATEIPYTAGTPTVLVVPVAFRSDLWCQICPLVRWNASVRITFTVTSNSKSLSIELLSITPDANDIQG